MDNRIGEMAVFVRVVELGSFSAAARALFMTPSSVSKLIRRLEDRLTLRLFDRSTRLLVLTEDGQRYYESATRLIAELDEVGVGADAAVAVQVNELHLRSRHRTRNARRTRKIFRPAG